MIENIIEEVRKKIFMLKTSYKEEQKWCVMVRKENFDKTSGVSVHFGDMTSFSF
jgi:hypothetical protein